MDISCLVYEIQLCKVDKIRFSSSHINFRHDELSNFAERDFINETKYGKLVGYCCYESNVTTFTVLLFGLVHGEINKNNINRTVSLSPCLFNS